MLSAWRKAFFVLTSAERRRAVLLLGLMVVMALFEVIGVASVMPFLAVLANPGMVETNPWLAWLYDFGGFKSPDRFLVILGTGSFVMLLLSAAVRSLTFYTQSLFIQMNRHSLSCRLLEGYLNQPYQFFLDRQSGDMSKNILSEVDLFVDRGLMPMAQMISQAMVLVVLLAFLLLVDPLTALTVALVIGGTYIVIYRFVRQILARAGEERLEANRRRFEAASEALGGIKSIKILGCEARYLERFRNSSFIMARRIALSSLLGQLPRYTIEAVAFGGIILMALILTLRQGTQEGGALATVLPILGLYAFTAYRILPAAQNIYQNVSSLCFARSAIEGMAHEITSVLPKGRKAQPTAHLRVTRALELQSVTYHYLTVHGTGITDVSLTLQRGQSLGIIGTTGAGKTTLVDVILGLLVPSSGQMLVDGTQVTDANRRAWQDNLGYVPQDIYLTDSSVAENIALGLDPHEIDPARVEEVARMARIHDFVVGELPEGYATRVGERGVRLSGGQRQRIGIARALYHDPEMIVFDEATSALDNVTEAEVMEAVGGLSGKKTLIIIAHRLSTVERCDMVVRLNKGRLTQPSNFLAT